tara:strand:- start:108 stop:1574 length:1467 start_codon:yes stop_codon:yes gene_type:complete
MASHQNTNMGSDSNKYVSFIISNLPIEYYNFIRVEYTLSQLVAKYYNISNIDNKSKNDENKEVKNDENKEVKNDKNTKSKKDVKKYNPKKKNIDKEIENILTQLTFNPKNTDNDNNEMNLHITEINQSSKLKVNMNFGLFNSTYEFIFKKTIPIHVTSISNFKTDRDIIPDESRRLKQIVIKVKESDLKNYDGNLMNDLGLFCSKYWEKNKFGRYVSEDSTYTVYINDEKMWDDSCKEEHRPFETIYLPKGLKDELIEDIEKFLEPDTKLKYQKIGRKYKRISCLEGLPGTGKTSVITALASYIGYDIAIITPSVGAKFTDLTFKCLLRNLPSKTILVFEDMDALFNQSRTGEESKHAHTFSGLLNGLDGIGTPSGLICFITTNNFNSFDPALKRRGRIDKVYNFDYMNKEQLYDMFKNFMEDGFTEEKFIEFFKKFQSLNLKVTVSTMQEYLFQYIDEPDEAINNLKQLNELNKSVSNKSNTDNMYH